MPQRAKRRRLIQYITAGVIICAPMAQADPFVSPDIVILDDSQISFGSGPVFLEFFENIKAHCPPPPKQQADLAHLGEMSVAVIGVRSTSLHSWTARMGRAKGAICDVDPKWKVNAGNKHSFRLNKSGKVKDPYHPNLAAAKNFFALEMDDICNAI